MAYPFSISNILDENAYEREWPHQNTTSSDGWMPQNTTSPESDIDNSRNAAPKRKRRNGSESTGGGSKRRNRVNFTAQQISFLEEYYINKNQFIKPEEKVYLANTLGLEETNVKHWFQNRRSKDKRSGIEVINQSSAHNTPVKNRRSERDSPFSYKPSDTTDDELERSVSTPFECELTSKLAMHSEKASVTSFFSAGNLDNYPHLNPSPDPASSQNRSSPALPTPAIHFSGAAPYSSGSELSSRHTDNADAQTQPLLMNRGVPDHQMKQPFKLLTQSLNNNNNNIPDQAFPCISVQGKQILQAQSSSHPDQSKNNNHVPDARMQTLPQSSSLPEQVLHNTSVQQHHPAQTLPQRSIQESLMHNRSISDNVMQPLPPKRSTPAGLSENNQSVPDNSIPPLPPQRSTNFHDKQHSLMQQGVRHQVQGHQVQGHQLQGHQVQGHQLQGHQIQGHQIQGHQIQGHQIQGHQIQGHQIQGHQIQGHQGQGQQKLQPFPIQPHIHMNAQGLPSFTRHPFQHCNSNDLDQENGKSTFKDITNPLRLRQEEEEQIQEVPISRSKNEANTTSVHESNKVMNKHPPVIPDAPFPMQQQQQQQQQHSMEPPTSFQKSSISQVVPELRDAKLFAQQMPQTGIIKGGSHTNLVPSSNLINSGVNAAGPVIPLYAGSMPNPRGRNPSGSMFIPPKLNGAETINSNLQPDPVPYPSGQLNVNAPQPGSHSIQIVHRNALNHPSGFPHQGTVSSASFPSNRLLAEEFLKRGESPNKLPAGFSRPGVHNPAHGNPEQIHGPLRPGVQNPAHVNSEQPHGPPRLGVHNPVHLNPDQPHGPPRPGVHNPAHVNPDQPHGPPRPGIHNPVHLNPDQPHGPPRPGVHNPAHVNPEQSLRPSHVHPNSIHESPMRLVQNPGQQVDHQTDRMILAQHQQVLALKNRGIHFAVHNSSPFPHLQSTITHQMRDPGPQIRVHNSLQLQNITAPNTRVEKEERNRYHDSRLKADALSAEKVNRQIFPVSSLPPTESGLKESWFMEGSKCLDTNDTDCWSRIFLNSSLLSERELQLGYRSDDTCIKSPPKVYTRL